MNGLEVVAGQARGLAIPPMNAGDIERIRALDRLSLQHEQTPIDTHHLLHAGMYVRTILIQKDVLLTGVLIKRPTVVIVSGDVSVFIGHEAVRLTGYHLLAASAHRKQAFLAHADTYLSMQFPTQAKTVEEAEAEFTDEVELLFSRYNANYVTITGE